jgi:hypothetical protein
MCGGFDLEFNFTTPLLCWCKCAHYICSCGWICFVLLLLLLLSLFFLFWLNFGTSKFNIQKLHDRSINEKKILTETI